jgi:transposase
MTSVTGSVLGLGSVPMISARRMPARRIMAVSVLPCAFRRVLAEIGDDRSRFQDAKGLKAYAGAAPITRASGKTKAVTHRRIKNNRLNAAGYIWAFSALTASPGARAHYDRRKDAGDRHAAAERNLFSRLLGCLWHCLTTGQHYDEATAFPAATKKISVAA